MSWSHDYWMDLVDIDAVALRQKRAIGRTNTAVFTKRKSALVRLKRVARGICPMHAAPVVTGKRCCRKCLDKGRAKRNGRMSKTQ